MTETQLRQLIDDNVFNNVSPKLRGDTLNNILQSAISFHIQDASDKDDAILASALSADKDFGTHDLNFTGNRSHNAQGFLLEIVGISQMKFVAPNAPPTGQASFRYQAFGSGSGDRHSAWWNQLLTEVMSLTSNGRLVVANSYNVGTHSINASGFQKIVSGADGWVFSNSISYTAANGVYAFLKTLNQISPTSGTAEFNDFHIRPTVNQTGGANGIVRGVYIDPIITNAPNWIALEAKIGKILVAAGDLECGSTTNGLVQRSPNGQRWRWTVSNAGIGAWAPL